MNKKIALSLYLIFTSPLIGMEQNIGPIDYPTVPKIFASLHGDVTIHFRERTDHLPQVTVKGTDPQHNLCFTHVPNDSLSIRRDLQTLPGTAEYSIYYPAGVLIELHQDGTTVDIDSVSNLQAILKRNAQLTVTRLQVADVQIQDEGSFNATSGRGDSLKITVSGGNAFLENAHYTNIELTRNPITSVKDSEDRTSRITITNADINTLKATLRTAYLDDFNAEQPAIGIWGQVKKANLQIFPNIATEKIFVENVTEELVQKVIPTQNKGRNSSIAVEKKPQTQ
jgi:hypothetical protein